MSDTEKTDAEKIEAIEATVYSRLLQCVSYEVARLGNDVLAILSPPKPKGWIDKDNLPEVGTVFEYAGGTYYFIAKRGSRLKFWQWNKYSDYIYASTIDEWNRMLTDGIKTITAVHKPAAPKKPKIRLITNRLKNVGVGSVHRQYWVAPLDGATPPDAAINGLRTVLEDVGIDVEIIA